MPTRAQLSDEELMGLYLGGDTAAFEEIYRRFAPRLYHYILQKVRSEAQSEELFQTVFLKFHTSRRSFRIGEPLAPWLFTIARNCTHDWARRRALEKRAQEVQEPEATRADMPSNAEGILAHPVLSEREREVLALRFEQDQPFSRVAARIGASTASARQIAHRAIVKLKKALREK